jgi:hypothetical protein
MRSCHDSKIRKDSAISHLALITHGKRRNYDAVSIEGRDWKGEAERRAASRPSLGAWLGARVFLRRSLHKLSLQSLP